MGRVHEDHENTQPGDTDPASAAETPGAPAPRTGDPRVDEVLRSLEDLEQRPLTEHVGVFESAHERLRAVLSEAGDPAPGPDRG